MSELSYKLGNHTFELLPGPGGYSGYQPKWRRTDEPTLSDNIGVVWGLIPQDSIIELAGPSCRKAEYLSLRGMYEAAGADGLPLRYTFDDGSRTFEVEMIACEGQPYRHGLKGNAQGLYTNVRVALKVLSVGAEY